MLNRRAYLSKSAAVAVTVLSGAAYAARPKTPGAASLTCSLLVDRAGAERGLSFVVRNEGRDPAVLRYFRPAMPGAVTATVAGARVSITQPALDIGVQRAEQAIAPGASVTVRSAIRVRFEPPSGAPRNDSRFLWTVAHAPVRVELSATFGNPDAVACRGVLEP